MAIDDVHQEEKNHQRDFKAVGPDRPKTTQPQGLSRFCSPARTCPACLRLSRCGAGNGLEECRFVEEGTSAPRTLQSQDRRRSVSQEYLCGLTAQSSGSIEGGLVLYDEPSPGFPSQSQSQSCSRPREPSRRQGYTGQTSTLQITLSNGSCPNHSPASTTSYGAAMYPRTP